MPIPAYTEVWLVQLQHMRVSSTVYLSAIYFFFTVVFFEQIEMRHLNTMTGNININTQ
jgi:hypothetical protein